MAHFAYIVDGSVRQVHVVNNDVITDSKGVESEALGQKFLASLHGKPAKSYIQCSYNGSMRGVYPAVGFTYDPVADVFGEPVTGSITG